MKCHDCKYGDFKKGQLQGYCRRNPPFSGGSSFAWPGVSEQDWCGEHKPRKYAQKKTEPKSDTQEVIAHYCDVFKEHFGTNPNITGKDAGSATRMLKTKSIEQIKNHIDLFFRQPPIFYSDNNLYGLNHVESSWDKIVVQQAKSKTNQPEYYSHKDMINEQAKHYGSHEKWQEYCDYINNTQEVRSFETYMSEYYGDVDGTD